MKHFASIDRRQIRPSPHLNDRPGRLRWLRVFAVWAVMVCAEVMHGTIRTLLIAPIVGDFRSRQVGVFTGSLVILSIAFVSIRWVGALRTRSLLEIGVTWLALMVLFEIGFGRLVVGASWQRLWADCNILEGGLLPIGFVVLALSPLIAARVRHIQPKPAAK